MRFPLLETTTARRFVRPALIAALAVVMLPISASAQIPGGFQPLNLSGGNAEPTGPVVKAKGVIVQAADGKSAQLVVTADVEADWHIYSITQPPGGPIRTTIKIPPSADYKLGEFKPSAAPHAEPSPEFNNIIVETHDGSITWTAPLDLSPGVDSAKLKIEGAVNAQACSNTCLPPQDYKFVAQVAGAAPAVPTTSAGPAVPTSPANSTSTLPKQDSPLPIDFKPLNLTGGVSEPEASVVKVSAQIVPGNAEKQTHLNVTATMEPKWHIYSITQPPGGPLRTQIKIAPSADYKLGEFVPTKPPHAEPSKAFTNVVEETHEGTVTWTAPIQLGDGVNSVGLVIKGSVFAQACNNVCLPPQDYSFTAQVGDPSVPTLAAPNSFAPPTPTSNAGAPPLPGGLDKLTQPIGAPPVPTTGSPATVAAGGDMQLEYKASLSHVTWSGNVAQADGRSDKVRIVLRAVSDPEWHIYASRDVIPDTGNRPTIIVFDNTSGLTLSKPTPDIKPITGHEPGSLDYFEQPVVWSSEITIPPGTKPGVYRITGSIGYQTCKESTCDPPKGVNFESTFTIEGDDNINGGPVRFVSPAAYKQVEAKFAAAGAAANTAAAAATTSADPLANIQVRSDDKPASLPYMILIAFMAGFILNFMPCVLPVIGLKVLSFVEQSGHDRSKILKLNLWYAVGMLTVFWVLAAIPIVFKTSFGWGQQFSYDGFTITLCAIVFVMALSFLGVWEIPIPGFAGGSGAQKLASKEGVSGAYFKGIITTLLATPCSGPGLAAAVGFAFRESAPIGFAIFTAMGLGMASPYILIGFQPSLLRFLPKPGEWMDTFKQIMGFVLLGTVVWLMTSLPFARLVPTVTLMFGLWAACWWIGRTPVYAEFGQKTKAWIGAAAFGALIGWFSFGTLQGIIDYRVQRFIDGKIQAWLEEHGGGKPKDVAHAGADALNWQHLSLPQLQTAFASNQTVLVDFTADWCATCKLLKSLHLDRPETKKLVDDLGVLTFEADMTNPPQELSDLLRKLNPSGGVPVIAIFPAGDPSRPIVFADGYTQTQIFDALRKAGKSKPKTAEASVPNAEQQVLAPTKQVKIDNDPAEELDWKFMTVSRLRAELTDRKTVLINYTSDWCPTCKPLRAACLNELDTKQIVEDLGVVCFEADMTRPPDEMKALLKKLNPVESLPTWVVFSASNPSSPIVIADGHSKDAIHKALRDAGKSLTKTNNGAVGSR